MKSWQPVSLAKCLNVEVILIFEIVISGRRINSTKLFEVILITEFMNPEIRITSIFRFFCQAGRMTGYRITFRKKTSLISLLL